MEKLKITILYDAIEDKEKAEAEEKGEKLSLVYEQVAQVLTKRGHEVHLLAAGPKIRNLVSQIDKDDSDIIFNLCESLGGISQHEQNVASLLELLDKKFTGSGSIGLALAQDKALAKKLFSFHGIKYPKFSVIDEGQVDWSDDLEFPLFIKPLNQDASIGIDDRAIVHNVKELMERISYIQTEFKTPALIEEFIEGREIYVGILGNEKPEALPIIEWDFSRVPDGVPKIASAEAKWDEDSEAYKEAPSIFPEDIPEPVYKKIQETAITAFKALKLRDYGRVDMRLRQVKSSRSHSKGESNSGAGNGKTEERATEKENKKSARDRAAHGEDIEGWEFYIIEVNPNPHLARNSELALAARKHGLTYPDLIEKIIELALARSK
jgi:D-alanine-D-alanine ligase